jgi:hypothetical protein
MTDYKALYEEKTADFDELNEQFNAMTGTSILISE